MSHAKHAALYITACPSCNEEYLAARVDPMRPPETDEEPWTLPPADPRLMGDDGYGPSRQRWALILGVSALVAIGLFLVGGTRV